MMLARRNPAWLCLATGFVTLLMFGWFWSESEDLWSRQERLWQVDLGPWQDWTELGWPPVTWSFVITPFSAAWGIVCSVSCCFLNWNAIQKQDDQRFGLLGTSMWLVLLAMILAADLMAAYALQVLLSALVSLWLYRGVTTTEAASRWKRFVIWQVIGDACCGVGLMMAAGTWNTFDVSPFLSSEFVFEQWRLQPWNCGLAGTLLWLGLAARWSWLFALRGLDIAGTDSPAGTAWGLGFISGGSTAWLLVSWQPMLSCAPETVALAQGLAVLAAVSAALVALVPMPPPRAILLLAGSQYALLSAVFAVPNLLPAACWIPCLLAPMVSAAAALSIVSNGPVSWWSLFGSLWCLSGSACSPVFMAVALALQELPEWQPPTEIAMSAKSPLEDAEFAADGQAFRIRPLPISTFTAWWCGTVFLAGVAAARLGTQILPTLPAERAYSQTSTPQPRGGMLVDLNWPLLLVIAVSLVSLAPVLRGLLHPSSMLAFAAGSCGVLAGLLTFLRRDAGARTQLPLRLESVFAKLETWLGDLPARLLVTPLERFAVSVENTDAFLTTGWQRYWDASLMRGLKAPADELRNESPRFYAVALCAIIGSLLVTWWYLTG